MKINLFLLTFIYSFIYFHGVQFGQNHDLTFSFCQEFVCWLNNQPDSVVTSQWKRSQRQHDSADIADTKFYFVAEPFYSSQSKRERDRRKWVSKKIRKPWVGEKRERERKRERGSCYYLTARGPFGIRMTSASSDPSSPPCLLRWDPYIAFRVSAVGLEVGSRSCRLQIRFLYTHP